MAGEIVVVHWLKTYLCFIWKLFCIRINILVILVRQSFIFSTCPTYWLIILIFVKYLFFLLSNITYMFIVTIFAVKVRTKFKNSRCKRFIRIIFKPLLNVFKQFCFANICNIKISMNVRSNIVKCDNNFKHDLHKTIRKNLS